MDNNILYVSKKGEKNERKPKQGFPIIKRTDIMKAILSSELDTESRLKLSNLYAEIIYTEKLDFKYISEIAVSSEKDLEIYQILRKLQRQQKNYDYKFKIDD